ncbi:TRAM domain-containing protein [Candidatus Woesearchaeota archaeon]|nr:TRAM domain-containing protein [Candidatus Woesearchaeota archaeon]
MYGNQGGFQPRSFAPVNVGDEVDVKIEAVGDKGDGIAKIKGFVLFIPNAKEGEEVKVKITKVLRRVGFAEVVGAGSVPAEEAPAEEAPAEEAEEPASEAEAEPKEEAAEEAEEPASEAEAEPKEEAPAEEAEEPAPEAEAEPKSEEEPKDTEDFGEDLEEAK